MSHPNRFYYLPDAFKLGRRMEPPFAPGMSIQVDQGETEQQAAFVVTCLLRPYVDGHRLLAAQSALQAHVPVASGTTGAEAELRPLPAVLERPKLRLGLPSSAGVMVDIGADVDLANGFLFTTRFGNAEFQDVFAAMGSAGLSTLLQGSVVVATGLATEELVPTSIRFQDMVGEVFQFSERTDAAAGVVSATLRNATESPLKITALPVWLARGGVRVEGRIEGLDLSAPLELQADSAVSFVIQPTAPLPGEGPMDAIFDTARVAAVPNLDRILQAVMDPRVDMEGERKVFVETSADVLASADQPDQAIRLIIIEFRGNRNVRLDANQLSAEANVPVPLADILLRKDTEGFYDFRQTVVYKAIPQVTGSWQRSDLGYLFVPLETVS